jgi:hypothetical protein
LTNVQFDTPLTEKNFPVGRAMRIITNPSGYSKFQIEDIVTGNKYWIWRRACRLASVLEVAHTKIIEI